MSKTYLDGKLTVSSLAVPTSEDIANIRALSDEDYARFRDEVRTQASNSPATDTTVDEVWTDALKEAKRIKSNRQYAV